MPVKRLTLALLLLAACGSARPSALVTPSGDLGAVETERAPRTGVSQVTPWTATPVATASAAPQPSAMTIDPASAENPAYAPEGLSGQATWWFSFGHGLYAALRPDLGTKGDLAIVCGGKPWHCLSLPVITSCACLGPGSRRLIDLSRDAFESFADPSVGTIRVSLQIVEGGAP